MPVEVHVTAECIRNGQRGKTQCCAIALALNETTGQRWEVWPGDRLTGTWKASLIGSGYVRCLPAEASKFARRFDNGEPVHPFTFTLEL